MDMPFRMCHTLYKSAWEESVAKSKEVEAAEKEAEKEEKIRNKRSAATSREALSVLRGINSSDIEDLIEDS